MVCKSILIDDSAQTFLLQSSFSLMIIIYQLFLFMIHLHNCQMDKKVLKLRVSTAALRLKFKCKLRIEAADGTTTQEVLSRQNIFTIQEELHLYPRGNSIQLSLMLISDKGSHYNGGCVKATLDQLRHSQGLPLKLPVNKCIDKQAWVEVKAVSVPQLSQKSSQKELSFTQQRLQNPLDSVYTPERTKKGNLVIQSNLAETRSQHGFAQPVSFFNLTQERKRNHDNTRPVFGQFSNVRMQKGKEARKVSPFESSPRHPSPEQLTRADESNRMQQTTDLSVGKLKKIQERMKVQQQNLRAQRQKRKNVELSEHGYKMEVVKLNITRQQKEKQLAKKDQKIRDLQSELNKLKEGQKKMTQLKEEINNKNAQNIALKEEVEKNKVEITKAHIQNQSYRSQFDDMLTRTKREAQSVVEEKLELSNDLTRKLKSKQQELASVLQKISKIQQENQRQRKAKMSIDNRQVQTKNEYQKTLNALRKQLKACRDDASAAISKHQKERVQTQKQISLLREECERLRVGNSKLTIEKRSLQEQLGTLQQSTTQLKRYRQKYQDEHTKTKNSKQQLAKLKKKYESAVQSTHKIEERLKNSYQSLQEMGRNERNLQLRCRESDDKVRKVEDQLNQLKKQAQRQRRSEEAVEKENQQLKEREKQLKSQLSRKEVDFTKLKLQMQNMSQKLAHTRQSRSEMPQKTYIYGQKEEWQQSKMNSLIETQKYLEMQISAHKHTISQLQAQIVRFKQEGEKYIRLEYEWRQQQRNHEIEKARITADNQKLLRETKEISRKMAQEEANVASLNQKMQREKKNSKTWQQKYTASESALRKTNDRSQQLSSELEIREGRMRTMQNELQLLKAEAELRQNESQKLRNTNEVLQVQNRRLRQQVGQLGARLREQQQASISENKRSREEMSRYEARLVNYKRQAEKFKESLRNVIVDSIISQLPKEQSEGESLTKRRENKLGLTLTNQLIIRLEEYLRELSRSRNEAEQRLKTAQKQLVSMREQSILNTNQFQNSEAQLKDKMDELMDSLAKMKEIYQSREQQMRKSLAEAQWQISINNTEIEQLQQSAAEAAQRHQKEKHAASETFSKTEKALNSQLQKLRLLVKEQSQKEGSYGQQIASLEEYVVALEEKIVNYRNKEFQLQQKFQKTGRQFEEFKATSETLALSLQDANRLKSQLKNALFVAESEAHECKLQIERYKHQLQQLQTQKDEGSSQTRNIMKQKEALLHQFLSSEEKVFQLQTKLFALQDQLTESQTQKDSALKLVEEMKQQKKKIGNEGKSLENTLSKKEGQLKQLQQKLKQKQKQLGKIVQQNAQLQTSLFQLKAKLQYSNKSWQMKVAEFQHAIDIKQSQVKALTARNDSLLQKCDSLEMQLRKVRESAQQLQFSLEEVSQRLGQSLQVNQKIEVQLFSLKSEVVQLREDARKVKEELEERDLKNYMLSSDIYKVETESSQQIAVLQQKNVSLEEAMLKYEQICEDYTAEIEVLKVEKENWERRAKDAEYEVIRMEGKWKKAVEDYS